MHAIYIDNHIYFIYFFSPGCLIDINTNAIKAHKNIIRTINLLKSYMRLHVLYKLSAVMQ